MALPVLTLYQTEASRISSSRCGRIGAHVWRRDPTAEPIQCGGKPSQRPVDRYPVSLGGKNGNKRSPHGMKAGWLTQRLFLALKDLCSKAYYWKETAAKDGKEDI